MGNKCLETLQFNSEDEDLRIFRRLYQRHSTQQIPRSFVQKDCIQENNEIKIILHNESFSEIIEKQRYINLKNKNINVNLDFYRFSQGQCLLLQFDMWLNGTHMKNKLIRLIDAIHQKSIHSHINILDIADPHSLFPVIVKPDDELIIQYKYLYIHQIFQSTIHSIKLPLSLECPFTIECQLLIQLDQIKSPTHKIELKENIINIKFHKGIEQPLFILLFTLPNQDLPKLYIYKTLFGTQGYSQQQKYCLLTSMLPNKNQLCDEMFYFNCDDPIIDQEQETMETIPWTTIATIRQQGITNDNLFYSINDLQDRKNVIFFLDQSNSMDGSKIDFARQALQIFIKSLPPNTYFNLYSFGSKWKKMYDQLQIISEQRIIYTENYIKQLQGNMGSTFMVECFKDAIQGIEECVCFILTDGRIADCEELLRIIKQNKCIQIYSVGIGIEFDPLTVEQLAHYGRGNFTFCQNLNDLSSQVIDLLQQALQPQLQMISMTTQNEKITQIFPNPSLYQQKYNQHIQIFTYLESQCENDMQIEMKWQFQDQLVDNHTFKIDLKKQCVKSAMLHIYGYSRLLEILLLELDNNEFPSILTNQNKPLFYEYIKLSQQYMYLNPMTALDLGQFILVQKINIQRFKKIVEEHITTGDILNQLISILPTQEKSYEEILSNQNSIMDIQIKQESVSMEMGSSFTQANQEYLIRLISLQQMDGSFDEIKTIPLICLVKNPMDHLLQKMPEYGVQQIVNGRISQPLPKFMMSQIWATALTIAYLKINFRPQRGQWLLIYIKAMKFLKTYTKNWQGLLYKARKDLIQANFH